ncbi:MAG TPA: zinc-ribbon domain-containing protein [Segetibacter sp.]|jgi:hypothetical protein
MFCKSCGQENKPEASFCKVCGTTLSLVGNYTKSEKRTTATVKNDLNRTELNVFQKIVLLISVVWILICLCYTPFKDKSGIVYNYFWTPSIQVDWVRFFVHLTLVGVPTIVLLRYFKHTKISNTSIYKKRAKKEFYILVLFVLSMGLCLCYVCTQTYINNNRKKTLTEKISILERQREENSFVRNQRSKFWFDSNQVFDLREYNGNIQSLWEMMINSLHDEQWLNYFYQKYNYTRNYSWNGEPPGQYNRLRGSLGINSPQEMKSFIEQNRLTPEVTKKDAENRKINESLGLLYKEREGLTIYDNEAIRRIFLVFTFISFSLFYVFRPMVWFIKGLIKDIS